MKFQHLKIGQQFEYQGETYVKSSPLVAHHIKTGQTKLIPRYAAIVVSDSVVSSAHKKSNVSLESNQVLTAFESFYTCLLDSLHKLGPECETQALEAVQDKINTARDQFLSELGLQE